MAGAVYAFKPVQINQPVQICQMDKAFQEETAALCHVPGRGVRAHSQGLETTGDPIIGELSFCVPGGLKEVALSKPLIKRAGAQNVLMFGSNLILDQKDILGLVAKSGLNLPETVRLESWWEADWFEEWIKIARGS